MSIRCCEIDDSCSIVIWLTESLPDAENENEYSFQLQVLGLRVPIKYYLASGSLPPGLSLSQNGLISGIPILNGEYTFTVQAADENKCNSFLEFTLTVDFPVVLITEDEFDLITESGVKLIEE